MQTEQIIEKVRSQILEITYANESEILNDTKIFENGYVDSMGFTIIIRFLEKTFTVSINDRDLIDENFESINAITKFVIDKSQNT